MFSQQYMPFIKSVALVSADSQTKVRILAAAVAVIAAGALPVPSSPVDSPTALYNTQCAVRAHELVGGFNEASVLDCKLAIELARKFWQLRYSAVHQFEVRSVVAGGFFMGLLGAARLFSPEEISFFNEYANEITTLVRDASVCVVPSQVGAYATDGPAN